MQRHGNRARFRHGDVAILALGVWGAVFGAMLSAPMVGATVGALAGAALAAVVDHRSATEWRLARRSVEITVVPVRTRRSRVARRDCSTEELPGDRS
jgi:hypothetical protein